jgi:hypothetical protein
MQPAVSRNKTALIFLLFQAHQFPPLRNLKFIDFSDCELELIDSKTFQVNFYRLFYLRRFFCPCSDLENPLVVK